MDVVPYYGSVAARSVMHDNEIWLQPSSLDSRAMHKPLLHDRVGRLQGGCGWAASRREGAWRTAAAAVWAHPAQLRASSVLRALRPLAGPLPSAHRRPSAHPPAVCSPLPLPSPPEQVPKADVVLASYEAFASDASELKAFTWEVVVLDERNRAKASLAKAHQAATDMAARCA